MFGETPIVHVMIWNHPIETVLKINFLFGKKIQKWKPQLQLYALSHCIITLLPGFDSSQVIQ